jgi:hypothetical protein
MEDLRDFLLCKGFIEDSFSMGDYEVEVLRLGEHVYSKASFGDEHYSIEGIEFQRQSFIEQVIEDYGK